MSVVTSCMLQLLEAPRSKLQEKTKSNWLRHNEENFMQDEDTDMRRREDTLLGGTKISFPMLQERLKSMGIDWSMVWTKMVDVVLKSLCMAEDPWLSLWPYMR